MKISALIHLIIPSFRGRIGLRPYTKFKSRVYCATFLIALVGAYINKILYRWFPSSVNFYYIMTLVVIMLYLLLWVLSLNSRRLHDIGRAGWWSLNPLFIVHRIIIGIDEEGEPCANKWGRNAVEEQEQPQETAQLITPEIKKIYVRAVCKYDKHAQLDLARRYFTGNGMQQSKMLALRWAIKALDNGNADAKSFINSLNLQD